MIGAVIVAISVLGYVGNRQWLYLLDFLLGLVLVAVVAKSLGLLSELTGRAAAVAARRTRKPEAVQALVVAPAADRRTGSVAAAAADRPRRSRATRPSSTTCSTRSTPTAWTP